MSEKMMPLVWCAKQTDGFMERFVNNANPPEVIKRPSVESLWQAFWETPHGGDSWIQPKGSDGKDIPVNPLSFKYEVVRRAFELDYQRSAPFAFCCAEGGGSIEGCCCVNKDHGTVRLK